MDLKTARYLIDLNHKFYTEFGGQFSATRRRIQPGIDRIIPSLQQTENILDVGCGNGEFARALAVRGMQGSYLGLDFSQPLLDDAREPVKDLVIKFQETDLTGLDWDKELAPGQFSVITAFAVLHHIPGMDLRLALLKKLRRLLNNPNKLILSNWQFLNSEKLRKRIQPWEKAGLSDADVDENDYLLDWRSGGEGLRYAHHYSSAELDWLAGQTGFNICETFLSDGEGGRLGLYQIWEAC